MTDTQYRVALRHTMTAVRRASSAACAGPRGGLLKARLHDCLAKLYPLFRRGDAADRDLARDIFTLACSRDVISFFPKHQRGQMGRWRSSLAARR